MGTPTQVTGQAAETPSAANTAGFMGWSPETDRTPLTLLGGSVNKGAYADNTAYVIGDVVTYNGAQYRAKAAVASNNTTKPALGATWADAGNKRGICDPANGTSSVIQPNR